MCVYVCVCVSLFVCLSLCAGNKIKNKVWSLYDVVDVHRHTALEVLTKQHKTIFLNFPVGHVKTAGPREGGERGRGMKKN